MRTLDGHDLVILVIIVLLAASLYGHHKTGHDLQRICELLGPHDLEVGSPRTAREEIDNICIAHEPVDDLPDD